jgi:beta-glucosidase
MTVEDFLFEPKKLESTVAVRMEARRSYKITLRTHSRDIVSPLGEVSPHSAKLCFEEEHNDRTAIAEAVEVAAQSDISVIIGGRTSEHESEGFDLRTLKLPESQIRMIRAVASVSQKTILVLHGGNPIDVSDFVDEIDVVIAAHFPGQEGAQAMVDIITGHTNPSGRLATTWPMRLDETSVPSFSHFPARDAGNGPVLRYSEGLQVGYRNPKTACYIRWPFGFGLSYSTFEYRNLKVVAQEEINENASLETPSNMISITVDVQNTSQIGGHEVIQVYSEPPVDSVIWKPRSELIAFTKGWLEPNESRRVQIWVSQRDVSGYWNSETKCWQSLNGIYKIKTGGCAAYIPVQDMGTWDGL